MPAHTSGGLLLECSGNVCQMTRQTACISLVGMQEYIVDTLCWSLLSKLLYGVSIALRAPWCEGTNTMHALIIVHNYMSSSSVTW